MTVLDEGRESRVEGRIEDGRVLLRAGALESALGFVAKPEGLCKDEVCVPVRVGSGLEVAAGEFDAAALASALGRPIAIDAASGAVFIGAAAAERASGLQSLVAPDFTLPDLDGTPHSLSDYRGKKVVLAAYASW